MIIVTGGAGLIGSNIIAALNDMGRRDILVVDNLTDGTNLSIWSIWILRIIVIKIFIASIIAGDDFGDIDAIFHQKGGITTTEWNGKYLMQNNYEYSKRTIIALLSIA